jgi:TolB-like protein/Flp pilus assembly protein TadD
MVEDASDKIVETQALPSTGASEVAIGTRKSVVVLPFVNLSSDPEQEYFSDGLTEDLLNRLAQIPTLKVPARSSSFHFKGKTDLQEIKRALGVDAVLEGSVRKSGSALRITAQLTDVNSGYNVWSSSYDRELTDIFAVQDDITAQIIAALEVHLDDDSKHLLSAKPVDPELYQLMLRGRYHWNQRSETGLAMAADIFEQATIMDPSYGPAFAGLADVYISKFYYGLMSLADSSEKARAAATRALELDSNLADAHTSLAHLLLHEWQWDAAEKSFLRAIEINPNYIVARHWYALCLTALGRPEDAVTTMLRAHDLDPLSIRINADLGMAYLAAGRYQEAVEQETQTLELAPESATPKWIRGMALEQMQRFDEAEQDMTLVLEAWQRDASILGTLGHLYGVSGKTEQARALLGELIGQAETTDAAFFVALIYAGLGEADDAFQWLDRAVTERSGSVRYLKIDARLEGLRQDPRYASLIERVGLPP